IKMRVLAAAELFDRDSALFHKSAEIYQVGLGVKGLHFRRTLNERDGLTARRLEGDKHATAMMLQRFGLPATHGVLVESPDEAASAMRQVGVPCVVKPTELSKGVGVATGLKTAAEVATAIGHALKASPYPVRVENHVEGHDHRLKVVGDDL